VNNSTLHKTAKKIGGVSLLETLAALVILSAGAAVMFTWFAQNAATLSRLKDAEDIEQGKLQAIEYVRTVNPVERPSGDITIEKYKISWSSRQTADTVRALTAMGTPGKYEISLYELTIKLARTGDATSVPTTNILLPVAGYKLVSRGDNSMFGGANPTSP
jgi:type II secretory pathway pseudopilin PulG